MQAKIKIELTVDLDKVKEALEQRNIVVNESNVKRFLKLIRSGIFGASDDMYYQQPTDQEILLMHGFTFKK